MCKAGSGLSNARSDYIQRLLVSTEFSCTLTTILRDSGWHLVAMILWSLAVMVRCPDTLRGALAPLCLDACVLLSTVLNEQASHLKPGVVCVTMLARNLSFWSALHSQDIDPLPPLPHFVQKPVLTGGINWRRACRNWRRSCNLNAQYATHCGKKATHSSSLVLHLTAKRTVKTLLWPCVHRVLMAHCLCLILEIPRKILVCCVCMWELCPWMLYSLWFFFLCVSFASWFLCFLEPLSIYTYTYYIYIYIINNYINIYILFILSVSLCVPQPPCLCGGIVATTCYRQHILHVGVFTALAHAHFM